MSSRRAIRTVRRRLIQVVPVILIVTFVVFGLIQLIPGDIAVTLAGDNASDQRLAEIRALYGLDRPFLVQYFDWLWGAVHGDLARSLISGEEVMTSLSRTFPLTLLIVVLAMLISMVIGIPLGILAALRPNSIIDGAVMGLASVGIAIPNFWLAMILVATFALSLGWLPATGAVAFSDDPIRALEHAILPATALAAGGIAEVARQLRTSLVDILGSQYVRTLHAKGLPGGAVLWKHGLKNVSVNLLTVIGLLANRLLAATVVVETVFAIPGVGNLIVNAALARDFPVVQGVVLTMIIFVVGLNLIIDMLYVVFDPRVR
ncbi:MULTISPECIES: ABC transporter permease [Tistrella]|jgi:peptide/nickel transport system permease protein|uniref:Peptide ABC transporter n=1 Tax=Tistrella mobilis TaxID=171437 RepID=A0A3B9ISS9_9PROT|nr:ABC transporter permease [Tistrella sp.]MAD37319.1 peptide ABC transporter [Tistrella sp.]MAM76658.1 peptide ABC transporter [Tistrella sp.]HAE50922.1 peptide ABC transporter [Tistrella mobilis]